ncbi:F-box/FBD/LRR-repeat protein At2g26030-like [Rhodamnia argentea]|uniref:F-box/FBD/LRR-repeat protein At2g26030-like n=1 Tax=Rhodamnia argentea TaxID=178133 RepID=A0A8B8MUG3_9MYRT|nr:F-box/FBD/LRR-repeat protein At2g26030-like [Rhodamnia argentea]
MAGTSKRTSGRKDDEDYIDLLPDCLIHHIFSFLPTEDAIKTCVLSIRWRFVWTTVLDLKFSISFFGSSYDESFVDGVLTQYAWAKISTPRLLSLCVRDHYFYESIRIVEAPSLLEADLDFDVPSISSICLLKQMFPKLQNATRILLGSWWAWVTRNLKIEDAQVSLPSCKSLTLHMPVPSFSFPAIVKMLAATPNLEKLFIILKPYDPSSSASDLDSKEILNKNSCRMKKKLKRWAQYLKNVDIFICTGKYGHRSYEAITKYQGSRFKQMA